MAAESTAPPTSPDDASRTIYRPKLSAKPLPTIKLLPPLPAPVAADANVSKQAIVGRVVDQVGKPVAGADVWFPVVWDKKNGRHTVHGATVPAAISSLNFQSNGCGKKRTTLTLEIQFGPRAGTQHRCD